VRGVIGSKTFVLGLNRADLVHIFGFDFFLCVSIKMICQSTKEILFSRLKGKKQERFNAREKERERERDITVLPSARESRTRGEKKIHDPLIATV